MKQELVSVVQSVIDTLGLEIYHIEFHKNVLRVLIEAKEGSVTIDTCALVSRQLSEKLDAVDLIPHRYRLEVSSPGIERTLYEPAHYKRAIGADCQIITKQGLFWGKIIEADDEKIKLVHQRQINATEQPEASKGSEITTIFYSEIKSGQLKVSAETLFRSGEETKTIGERINKER